MNEVTQLISSVGFPIFSFLLSAYFIKYSYDKQLESNKDAMNSVTKLAEAVNHNSEVLSCLVREIDKDNSINLKKED